MQQPVLFDFHRSSASYRVRIALNLAGIAYDTVPVDLLTQEHKTPQHLDRNPQGLVPVLEIDGHCLTQSLAILEYLNSTRKMGWLPSEPVQRAKLRALAYCIAVDIHPVCNSSVAQHAAHISGNKTGVLEDWMRHFIRPGLCAFEALLTGFEQDPFCTGSTLSIADICLVPQLYNADRWDVNYSDCPRIIDVAAACTEISAFRTAHPDAAPPA